MIVQYLESKGLHPRRASGVEIHLPCLWCGEDEGERGRMYVNTDEFASIPGLFHCFLCGESGSFVKIQKFFGDYTHSTEEHDDEKRLAIFNAATEYYQGFLNTEDHPEVLNWLTGPERVLDIETICDAQLGYAPPSPGDALWKHLRSLGFVTADIMATGLVVDTKTSRGYSDALDGMVTIPYRAAGNVVTIRGRKWPIEPDDKAKYKTLVGQVARIYNSEACWSTNEVHVAEGELDCLVLGQLGFRSIAVPGANMWQPNWDAYVETMRRVWVCYDPDAAGDQGAQKLIDRLGPKARRLRLPCDVTEWASQGHTAQELQDLMADAGRSTLLMSVDQAIDEHKELQKQRGIEFDCDLDTHLKPGLLPGQLMVVLASTSTGKTLLTETLLHRAASIPGKDLKFLFVTLEQTGAEWWERARRIWRFHNTKAWSAHLPPAEDIRQTDKLAAEFWRKHLWLVEKNRVSAEELEAALDDFEYEIGQKPDLVCVDYLGYFARSFKGERYQQVGDAIMELKAIAKDRRVPMVVPHQVSRGTTYGEEPDISAARDAGTVEETADFVLTLWRPDLQKGRTAEEKTGTAMVRLKKSRHGNVGRVQEFRFAPFSLVFVPDRDRRYLDASFMAQEEVKWDRERSGVHTWEQAVGKHRQWRTAP